MFGNWKLLHWTRFTELVRDGALWRMGIMPVQYTSIIQGNTGQEPMPAYSMYLIWANFYWEESLLSFLIKGTCNQVATMHDFQVQYNAVLNENGGLVDDITIYKSTMRNTWYAQISFKLWSGICAFTKLIPISKMTNESANWGSRLHWRSEGKLVKSFQNTLGQDLEDIWVIYKINSFHLKGSKWLFPDPVTLGRWYSKSTSWFQQEFKSGQSF